MELPASGHEPVLLRETLSALAPQPGQIVIDCTLGRAGHASAVAPLLGPNGLLIGCDVDPRNLEFARARLSGAPCQVRLFHANFAELGEVLRAAGLPAVNAVHGVLADLGLSTNQLFDPHYGLSFAQPMPLDMRIDPRLTRTAADLVNSLKENDLADVLYNLAQEHYSRRIARKISDARRLSPITTTDRLAEIVRSAVPSRGPKQAKRGGRGGSPERTERIDPATRTFLALRIAVNREVENLSALLERAPAALAPGGRLAVISFQSTEDRLVKQAFRSAEQTGLLRVLTKKPLSPAPDELAANPRSRSAKLRSAEKCAATSTAAGTATGATSAATMSPQRP
jgi:16S rRNA (cytosine1402-N4)-methyltransferase